MKKLLTASLPALALLALGGCTTSHSVATTEDDGVYYSSKDRTTAVARTASAPQSEAISSAPDAGEATNPDYQAPAGNRQQASNAPEYYDDNYTSSSYSSYDNSRFRRPYAGPTVGLAYYAPPVVFAPAYSYGWGAGDCGFSPYGSVYCDPFYSAYSPVYYQPLGFYRPWGGFGYGGPFVSIAFGYGRPWGGYGYGYGRPFYGSYGYDQYYGYNGYNRGYGGYYGGGRQIIRSNGNNTPVSNPILVGRRTGRGGDVLAGRGNTPTSPNTPTTPTTPGGGRRRIVAADPSAPVSGIVAPATPTTTTAPNEYGRRERNSSVAPNSPTAINDPNQPTGRRYREVSGSQTDAASPTTTDAGRAPRGRWRNQDDAGTVSGNATGAASDAGRRYEQPQQTDVQPIERVTRRPRLAEPSAGSEQSQPVYRANRQEQPVQQAQPQQSESQPQRTYERPQRTYEQPATTSQPQRSYERPAASQPSYSAPAGGGSNGNSGGGGGGRRSRF